MGIKFANQAFGTLASAITSGQTSITLTTGQGARFPAVTAGSGDYFLLTLANASAYEIVMCVARAGDVLTVFRGIEGTTAAAFNAGDLCENRMTAGSMLDLSAANESYRNVVRNGLMRIAQRGAGPVSANGNVLIDGWALYTTGAQVVNYTQQSDVGSFSMAQNSARLTVGTANAAPAAGDFCAIAQHIEGYLLYDMVGRPIAIRFEVRSAKTGIHSVSIRCGGSNYSYVMTYTITAANTWQVVTLAIPAGLVTTTGTWNFGTGVGVQLWFMLACGTTYSTATTNAWVAGNFIASTGQVNVLDTVGNIFAITSVQMEQNLVSSRLEIPEIATEWMRSLRYFYRGVPPLRGVSTGATFGRVACSHPVPMRAPPTLVMGALLPLYDGATATTIASITTNFSTTTVLEFDGASTAATAAGRPVLVYQGSGGQMDVSAEI